MSRSSSIAFSLLITLIVGACATVPPVPKLVGKESSGIGIAVEVRPPIKWPSKEAQVVYFVKVGDERDISQTAVIRSNYAKDGRIYLLNVPPGDYVAVAAFYATPAQLGIGRPYTTYTTYFPKELVELTRVSVEKGQFVFACSYVVDQSLGLSDADPIQRHYGEVIAPGAVKSGLGHMLSGNLHYRGSLHEAKRDDGSKREFLMRAKADLAEGGWTAFISGRLEGGDEKAAMQLQEADEQYNKGAGRRLSGQEESLYHAALGAPARDLATSYLSVDNTLKFIQLAMTGTNIILHMEGTSVTINKSNAEAYLAEHSERLSVYQKAIEERGFANIAGTYAATASNACTRTESFFAAAVQTGLGSDVTINQTGFKLDIAQDVEHEGRKMPARHAGVIAESSIAVVDSMNPDFLFHGNWRENFIELRPNVTAIRAALRPTWLPKLDQSALSNCIVHLKRK